MTVRRTIERIMPSRDSSRARERTIRWLRPLLVVGVLLFSAWIGYRPPPIPLFLFAGGLAFLLLALLAFHSMYSALTLLVMLAPLLDISLSTGTQSPMHFSLLLVMLFTGVWLARMLAGQRFLLTPTIVNRPLMLFNLAVLLSWVAGYAFWDPNVPRPGNAFLVQAGQVAMFVLSAAIFFLVSNLPLGEVEVKSWNYLIISIGLVGIGMDLLPLLSRPPGLTGGMLMWPFVLLWAQLVFNPLISRQIRLVGWLSLPLWAIWLYTHVLAWKGGWFPAILALGILLLMRIRLPPTFIAGVGVAVVLVVLLLASASNPLENILSPVALDNTPLMSLVISPELETGSFLRFHIWYDILRMTYHSPILGLGPANYMYYWQNPSFVPTWTEHANWWVWLQLGHAIPSHNMFVDIAAQSGLVGLALFSLTLVGMFRLAISASRCLPTAFLGAYAKGILAGFLSLVICSFFFADWLIPFVYNVTFKGFQHSLYSWLLVGSLVPLLSRYARKD